MPDLKGLFFNALSKTGPILQEATKEFAKRRVIQYLADLTPERTLAMIEAGVHPWELIDKGEQARLLEQLQTYKQVVISITSAQILEMLFKARPDLWSIIVNSVNGHAWFEAGLEKLKDYAQG